MTNSPIFCFDMDGTIADLYAVENWLTDLRSFSARPYAEAAPMMNFSTLARQLNAAQRKGAKLVIISWASKCSNPVFHADIVMAKRNWLAEHLPSVHWDEIKVVPYGTNKAEACGVNGENFILFDDEERHHIAWEEMEGLAFNPSDITTLLHEFNKGR
jgi:hypothetical protein